MSAPYVPRKSARAPSPGLSLGLALSLGLGLVLALGAAGPAEGRLELDNGLGEELVAHRHKDLNASEHHLAGSLAIEEGAQVATGHSLLDNSSLPAADTAAQAARELVDGWNEQADANLEQDSQQQQQQQQQHMQPQVRRRRSMESLRPGQGLYSREHFELCDAVFHEPDNVLNKFNFSRYGFIGPLVRLHTKVYSDVFQHFYDDFNELKASGGPMADQEKCLKDLELLRQRFDHLVKQKTSSIDLKALGLQHTYGRLSNEGLLTGHLTSVGTYSECRRLTIDDLEGPKPTRYCLASWRIKDWAVEAQMSASNDLIKDLMVVKTAVCLPKSCDSMNYKNKYQLVDQISSVLHDSYHKDIWYLSNLYCLPDEQSTIRQWWRYPKTALSVAFIGGWLALVAFATYKDLTRDKWERISKEAPVPSNGKKPRPDLYKCLSATNNLRLLFDTSKASSMGDGDGGEGSGHETAPPTTKKPAPEQAHANPQPESKPEEKKIVDLRCVEGVKVICMCYVILGHVLMLMTVIMRNGREMATTSALPYFMANLMPAFAVNAFFTITGLLTSYLLFQQAAKVGSHFLTRPSNWVAIIFYRYLRIMPMYALVVLYTKHIARFTSSGPFWDYGTSAISQRRNCQYEPWSWTLLFGANFKSPVEHCIPAAWYLANDFQFFLVTPFFIALLAKRPKLGERVVKLAILICYIAGIHSVLSADATDLRPVAQFMPHGFKTYVTFLTNNYTHPQCRIPAYLCGLLFGYILFNYEQDKRKALERAQQQRRPRPVTSSATSPSPLAAATSLKQATIDESNATAQVEQAATERRATTPVAGTAAPVAQPTTSAAVEPEPGWSPLFENYGIPLATFFFSICILLPFLGARIPFTHLTAAWMVAFVMPTFHLCFALSVGIYLLLATTSQAGRLLNRLLSANAWKPFARMSLCTVLINVEVVAFIVQSQSQTQYVDNTSHMAFNVLCIVSVYICSVAVCVLFEAPIRALLNRQLSALMSKVAGKKQKTD